MIVHIYSYANLYITAQLAWDVEYTDCIYSKSKNLLHNECPGYDIKQYDGEVPVILELWGMQSTPSLPSFPGLLKPGLVAPDRVQSMGPV